jgi:hypothetical protein
MVNVGLYIHTHTPTHTLDLSLSSSGAYVESKLLENMTRLSLVVNLLDLVLIAIMDAAKVQYHKWTFSVLVSLIS